MADRTGAKHDQIPAPHRFEINCPNPRCGAGVMVSSREKTARCWQCGLTFDWKKEPKRMAL